MSEERLQKIIAAAGITSRRKAEGLIEAGRVEVNGAVVRDLGSKADPSRDEIRVDGEVVEPEPLVWIALHKPPGVVSSVSDPHAEKVVVDLVGELPWRLYPAGRLDLESEGLILMTNDGELMHEMTRPGGPIEKVYEVTVRGRPAAEGLEGLRRGPELDGQRLLPCEIDPLQEGRDHSRYRVVLHEGKKNQIRRMFKGVGTPVVELVRVRIGPVTLSGLDAGQWRHLTRGEVRELRGRVGLEPLPATPTALESEGTSR